MTDWKEVAIADCITLQEQEAVLNRVRAEDQELKKAEEALAKAADVLTVLEEPYKDKFEDINFQIEILHLSLLKDWDIEAKTFKCDVGTATVRTSKSLIVTDNFGLIDRLTEILGSGISACECIRTFELSIIRKYMDADLIAGRIAHYDEKRSVIIKGAEDK